MGHKLPMPRSRAVVEEEFSREITAARKRALEDTDGPGVAKRLQF